MEQRRVPVNQDHVDMSCLQGPREAVKTTKPDNLLLLMPESQKPALSACVAYGAVFVNDGLVHVCVPEGHTGFLAFLSEVTLVFVPANLCIARRFGERRLRVFPDPRDHGEPACFTLR